MHGLTGVEVLFFISIFAASKVDKKNEEVVLQEKRYFVTIMTKHVLNLCQLELVINMHTP